MPGASASACSALRRPFSALLAWSLGGFELLACGCFLVKEIPKPKGPKKRDTTRRDLVGV